MKGNSKSLLRLVLFKFSQVAKKARVVRQIQIQLLKTVAGGVFDSFNKWKTIPENSSRNVAQTSRFVIALKHFQKHALKSWTWNPLKDLVDSA
jgi:hypothetical protein